MSSVIARLLIVLSLLSAAARAAPEPAPRTDSLDRIVAVVNDDIITRVELDRESKMATDTLRRQGTPLPERDVLNKQLLERLITKNVLTQYARQTGMRVPDADLDQALERIAADNKLAPSALRAAVEQTGVVFDRFREDVRGEILISRLREREVESRITVTRCRDPEFPARAGGPGRQNGRIQSLAHPGQPTRAGYAG